ncbi:hypothetical protein [Asaia sp. As-1742]|uniref:hypothetical protein n=1 Tax=Asaia sp. As-1742 TaxID=2608325 RepID=UPI0019641AD2|nr:hypothetical protein [Asaia sp. As-1742]
MATVLEQAGNAVHGSDLYDRGYGEAGVDFLNTSRTADNIIMNPPSNAAEGFVRAGLASANRKLALLMHLAFLEVGNRQRTIFSVHPPSRVWVFSERVTFYPKGAVQKGSGTTAYVWFVWDKSHSGGTELRWSEPKYKRRSLV